jgi:acyl-phosphate glycerol 3-phosphate acyltransferase
MFSYWLGLLTKKDLRQIGDGNPGGYNLIHATGFRIGILGIFLDFLKGFFPLALLLSQGWVKGPAIIPIAMAPILGHAFSPFMKFKGGKAIAVTFGVWSAVTRFEVSFVYAIILAVFSISAKIFKDGKYDNSDTNGVMVVIGMLILGIYLIFREYSIYIILLWVANSLILIYTNIMKLYKTLKVFTGNAHRSA